MFAHESYECSITAPDYIFYRWATDLRDCFLLLNVVQDNRCSGTEDETGGTTVEYFVSLDRGFDSFYHRVGKVPDFDELDRIA